MKIVAKYLTGGPISAGATIVFPEGSNQAVIVAGSDALYAWRADNGDLLSGFPVYGHNFFASKPAIVLDYQARLRHLGGKPVIFAGNDDDQLYGFDWQGKPLPGFPLLTGGDVYSSPVVADVDGDGLLELFVGSDDGHIHAWKLAGEHGNGVHPLPGWPKQTGGFVSATLVITDLNGDGFPEIIAGSWDGKVYVWRANGTLLPGWPLATGQSVWSAALVADVDNDGQQEIFVASDQVYAWRSDGKPLAGWPQETISHVVGTPAAADLTGDGQLEIIVAADQVYAWHNDGASLRGYPQNLDTYFWAAPVVHNPRVTSERRIYVAGWDGVLYSLDARGLVGKIRISATPLFATPVLANVVDDGVRPEIVVGAWDGNLYVIRDDQQECQPATAHQSDELAVPTITCADSFGSMPEAVASFITFPGPPSSRATMYYYAQINDRDYPGDKPFSTVTADVHPVPLVVHRGQMTGVVQPFPAGVRVSYWLESENQRQPTQGCYSYKVVRDWPGRMSRRLRKWKATR